MPASKNKPVLRQTTSPDNRLRIEGKNTTVTELPDGRMFLAFNTAVSNAGTASGTGYASTSSMAAIPDRSVNLVISRDDDGCLVAYENCPAVYNSIERLKAAVNTGFEVYADDPEAYEADVKRFDEKLKQLKVTERLDTVLDNREIYFVGALGKQSTTQVATKQTEINSLVSLDTNESTFKLIIDPSTGELGGNIGKGLDKKRPDESIIAVQQATKVSYNSTGMMTSTGTEYIPLTAEQVMILSSGKRGQYKGISSVRRVLRYVEELISLENTVRLMAKRPTQLIYTLGNEVMNFNNIQVPQSYITAAKQDVNQARKDYKAALMTELSTSMEKMATGDVLMQILEWGMDVKAVVPTESMDYLKYMTYLVDQIKVGILTSETLTNRTVASGLMEEKLDNSLVRRAEMEQEIILQWLSEGLFLPLMESMKIDITKVHVRFRVSEKEDDEIKWRTNFLKAQTLQTYTNAGFPIPEDMAEELGVDPTAGGINHPLYEKKLQSKIDGIGPRDSMEEDLMRATLNIYRGGAGEKRQSG